ncbi:energy-coupling factor transport system ATP-binding protein [Pelagirhabdus alkalitolerans]|uniref:Energy-coupling factor transport system ATP-binding protein n=1 Tax=Pelagirhabdus alkalitolerans TaxID=1612202 RepID=A0A1G6GRC8_9BACI|nr:ABC transporter ATP-binding protein [Pelagirhabdus alkalitolerans]SDB84501.1 energy-coupling factor transport system ATP-binding protein [Pelagirhabdus alkalitolerans]
MIQTAVIKVDQLTLFFEDYPEKPVLDAINFESMAKENLLILGPSGCGKSTLTHCLNGLYPRELDGKLTGDVFINSKSIVEFAHGEVSHTVGVVFQDPETQFCMFTVEDEIAFGLENKGILPSEMGKMIDHVLELVNMTPFKNRSITTLSGGQKQKLALACILAMEPDILVLDEPTANLDPVATLEFIDTLDQLQQQKEFSFIIIEHQLDGWVSLIDRCMMLNNKGQLFYNGNLRDGINAHRHTLEQQGIWIPTPTRLALNIEHQSDYTFDHLPITVDELAAYPLPTPVSSTRITKSNPLALKAEKLTWTKKSTPIINEVDLSLYEGEFITILGANGSGKSSLSKLIAGIEKPTKGSTYLYEKKLNEWKERDLRTKIGYVFQNPEHQFITDSVYDEVSLSLRIRGLNEADIKERVSLILHQCQLTGFEESHPYTLSQGQKRRLSVATMIVDNQSLLILDEPTFGQDANSTKQLLSLLQERNETGTSIVMITHDMEIVHQYADRVIVMEDGKIVLDASPTALWEVPSEQLLNWQLELPVQVKLDQRKQKDVSYVYS